MEIGAAIFFTDYSMAPTDLAVSLGDGVLQVVDMRGTAIVGHVNFAIDPAALLPAFWQRRSLSHYGGERWSGYLKCCTTAMAISPSREMIANARPYLERNSMTLSPQSAMSVATIAK